MRHSIIPALASSAVVVCLGAVAACGGSSDDGTIPGPAGDRPAPNGTSTPGSKTPSDVNGIGNAGQGGAVNPTAMPTATPSIVPTTSPTGIPTIVPSVSPTVIPTVIPSVIPTVLPTINPTPEPDETREFEFNYEGVPGPVKARVTREGVVTIDALPTELSPIVHLVDSSGRPISDTFCDLVASRAARGALDSVRDRGGFTIKIDALPTATKEFRYAALLKAIPLSSGMARIEPRLKLTSATARIVLEEGAITSILGNVFGLNMELRKLPVSTDTAQMTGEIFAQDLLCDLRSGKASIEFDVTTDKPGYSPRVKTNGFEGP